MIRSERFHEYVGFVADINILTVVLIKGVAPNHCRTRNLRIGARERLGGIMFTRICRFIFFEMVLQAIFFMTSHTDCTRSLFRAIFHKLAQQEGSRSIYNN